ncbi:hypothetical protein [Aeromonas sp.]|uniref:hypothetical protein n=1 Tax=Aeromonas sp. TaxID=647 RepID=UPI002585E17E|nr:hypothetical protein [Aeromonas sp.]MCX7128527.1 hypothetical protein [Aeromonas sp.]HEH9430545.1 hypothetical protein [Aeromonas sobria]
MDTLIGLILKAGTGLAGISSAVFLMVHAEWLKLPIFSKLSQAQTFYILILSLVLTFVFSLTLLIVHLKKSKLQSGSATANGNGVAIVSSGSGNVQVNQSSK